MHIISLPQPYAQQVVTGQLWLVPARDATDYRGPVAIHAGTGEKYQTHAESQSANMPLGAILGYGMLTLCTTEYWIRKQGSSIALTDYHGKKTPVQDTCLHPSDFTWGQLLRHMNERQTVHQHGRARRLADETVQTAPYRLVIEYPQQLIVPIPYKAHGRFLELDLTIERMLMRKKVRETGKLAIGSGSEG